MSLEPFYPLYSGSFFKEKQTNNSAIEKSFIVKNENEDEKRDESENFFDDVKLSDGENLFEREKVNDGSKTTQKALPYAK